MQRPKTIIQSIAVSASSLLYFLPAYTFWSKAGGRPWHEAGAALFSCVAIGSLLADGSLMEPPWTTLTTSKRWQNVACLVDRWLATAGVVFSLTTTLRPHKSSKVYILEAAFGILSLGAVHLARRVPKANAWEWVIMQSIWHLTSSLWVVYVVQAYDSP
jgi:hypothetical protein